MASKPLPCIAKEHYEALRKVAPDLPATHAQWMTLIEQKQREHRTIGFAQPVPVLPVEFVAYCLRRGLRGSVNTVLLFALDKAAGSIDAGQDDSPLRQRH